MIEIAYTPVFLRQFRKLDEDLQDAVEAAIERFRDSPKDESLRLHKLKGQLKGYWSFSVDYRHRIVCEKDSTNTWALLNVGDHDVYR